MPLILDTDEFKKLPRRRVKRTPRVSSPQKSERILRERMELIWTRHVYPIVDQLKQMISDGASYEQIGDMLDLALRQAEQQFGSQAKNIVDMWRMSIDKETRIHMHRALTKSLGVDITAILDTPEVQETLAIGSLEAADLIVTMPKDTLNKVAKAVMDNMRGVPLPRDRSLLQQIDFLANRENFKKHAKLIARDQTSKMTSLLNQTRQQMLGIDKYIWRTSKDQRVVGNPSGLYPTGNDKHGNHYIMEGKYCRWDDSSVFSMDGKTWRKRIGKMPKVHPGQDIQCRCYAEPVIDLQQIIKHSQIQ